MDIEKRLKEFKKIYQGTKPSKVFLEQGWQDLQDKMLAMEQAQAKKRAFYRHPFAFALMVIIVLSGMTAGVVTASLESLPGETLYPVKRLAEDMAERVSGNQAIGVQNRAREIVELSKKGGIQRVQQALEDYKSAVLEASSSGKNKEELEKELEEHEKEFEQIRQGPSEEEINQAIEISKSGRGKGNKQDESNSENDRKGQNHQEEQESR